MVRDDMSDVYNHAALIAVTVHNYAIYIGSI